MRGLRAALVLAAALVAGLTFGAPAASAAPWACDAYGYLFQGRESVEGSGNFDINEIFQVDLARGGAPTKLLDLAHPVNAVGFNVLDGFFYGIENNQDGLTPDLHTWSLVRVHSDGSVDDFGQPTGPGGTMAGPLASDGGYATGEVDRNGHYWVWASTAGIWYEIDLTASPPSLVAQGPLTSPAGYQASPDWAYVNGALYSHGIRLSDRQAFLLRFDPSNPAAGFTPVAPIAIPSSLTEGASGAAFSDASGYVYFSQNLTGLIFRVNPVTGQTIRVAQGATTSGNDGARCAAAVVPTITVTKTVDGRVRPADQFTVGLVEDTGRVLDTASTSGGGTTASTLNWPVSQGFTYTITDAMAAGSPTPLSEYGTSISCTDSNGNAVATGGSPASWTLTVANATHYTCNVTNSARADLAIRKTMSPSPIVPGEEGTYSLRVTNNGPATASTVNVSDPLPDGVSFVSAQGCTENADVVTCTGGALAAGQSRTYDIRVRFASSLDRCPSNTAIVSGNLVDPDSGNNTDQICPPPERRVDLEITKSPSQRLVTAGGQVMYTMVVRNNGPSDASDVKVVDPMAEGLTPVSAKAGQGSCSTAGGDLSCSLGNLRAGGSTQILVTANVWTTPGQITNTATVAAAERETNRDNNQDDATITVEPGPDPRFDLAVRKTASKKRISAGGTVRYRIRVTNSGPDAAPGVAVEDTFNRRASVVSVQASAGTCEKRLPISCSVGDIPAGGSVTITAVLRPREADCKQRNVASAVGEGTDTNAGNNLSRVDICVSPKLKVTKVAGRKSVAAGGLLRFTIKVTNRSRGVVARNVRTCDNLPSGLVYVKAKPRGKLSKGNRCWTAKKLGARKSKRYRITVRVLPGADGRKRNVATVSGGGKRFRDPAVVQVLGRQVTPPSPTG